MSQVTVLPTELHVQLNSDGLAAELLGEEVGSGANPESITLEAPFAVARRGNEVRLVLADGSQASQPVESLVHAVQEARTWAGWIAQGKVTALKELAERAGHSRRHTSQVLRLAALSPALSDAIRCGDHAPELTLDQLTQNIPLDSALQRSRLSSSEGRCLGGTSLTTAPSQPSKVIVGVQAGEQACRSDRTRLG